MERYERTIFGVSKLNINESKTKLKHILRGKQTEDNVINLENVLFDEDNQENERLTSIYNRNDNTDFDQKNI